jgi:hypothetical protein
VQGPTQSQTIDEFKKIERPKIINKQKKWLDCSAVLNDMIIKIDETL